MEASQNYIGTLCGLVVCADRLEGHRLSGRLYHFYSRTVQEFQSLDELVFKMEQLFDGINFPYPANQRRVFRGSGRKECVREETPVGYPFMPKDTGIYNERRKVMDEKELLEKHGDLGTFIVRVQHRQNSSWQGRITWSDKNQTVNFRSVWEMVRLIGDALDTISQQEEDAVRARWPETDGNT